MAIEETAAERWARWHAGQGGKESFSSKDRHPKEHAATEAGHAGDKASKRAAKKTKAADADLTGAGHAAAQAAHKAAAKANLHAREEHRVAAKVTGDAGQFDESTAHARQAEVHDRAYYRHAGQADVHASKMPLHAPSTGTAEQRESRSAYEAEERAHSATLSRPKVTITKKSEKAAFRAEQRADRQKAYDLGQAAQAAHKPPPLSSWAKKKTGK
jgi:hypothetical protein